jgi:hypothetical protein
MPFVQSCQAEDRGKKICFIMMSQFSGQKQWSQILGISVTSKHGKEKLI